METLRALEEVFLEDAATPPPIMDGRCWDSCSCSNRRGSRMYSQHMSMTYVSSFGTTKQTTKAQLVSLLNDFPVLFFFYLFVPVTLIFAATIRVAIKCLLT